MKLLSRCSKLQIRLVVSSELLQRRGPERAVPGELARGSLQASNGSLRTPR
jgi:hypothetical protein